MSPTSPSSGTVNTVSAFGSGGNENLFLIDGTNFTCPCAGVSRAEPSVDVIQEVQVQSVGASAEYGNIQGAVFNVVTKQGGDRFLYDASYYGQTSGLTSQPVLRPVAGQPSHRAGTSAIRYRDFTTNLGGPVVRERLWFFAGYQYLRDYDSQPGTDPELPEDLRAGQDLREAHVAAHAGPAADAELSRRVTGSTPIGRHSSTPFEATLRLHAHGAGHDLRRPDAYAVVQHGLGRARRAVRLRPIRRPEHRRSDDAEPVRPRDGRHQRRAAAVRRADAHPHDGKATLSHYQPALFGADHEWKVGTQIEKGEHYAAADHSRRRQVHRQQRAAVSSRSPRDPSNAGGLFITAAAFASDAVTIGNRVTINAGVRFDHSRAISQDLHAVDARGTKPASIVQGLGTLYTWNVCVAAPGRHGEAHAPMAGRCCARATDGSTRAC